MLGIAVALAVMAVAYATIRWPAPAVAVGFGFTAYMMYMIRIARGAHQTAHYAICTGFMALGMMLPGMFSGWLQENLGYTAFFLWIMIATVPAFIVAALIPLEAEFGKRSGERAASNA